jgi:hypothetical protein
MCISFFKNVLLRRKGKENEYGIFIYSVEITIRRGLR